MSSGTLDLDEKISGAKIDPLGGSYARSVFKGVIGTNRSINQSRIDPIGGRGNSPSSMLSPSHRTDQGSN